MGEGDDLLAKLNGRYGSSYLPDGRLILQKEKLFLYTGSDTKLKHVWVGLHIGNADLSLTIEGAQKLGTTASKNTVTITKEQAERYYMGEDLEGFPGEGHAILRTEGMTVGPGLMEGGVIKNTLPRSRLTRRAEETGDRTL